MPKVSILLTSYNHEKYIGESIESILNQTYKDFELVILDDASTDNSVKIIKSFKDKRIKPIFRKKNLNRAICKEVIEPLQGEYIAIAHCDDKWNKDKLEKQVKYLDKHKNNAACFTWVELIDEFNNRINEKANYTNFNVKNRTRYEWLNNFFYNGNCLCHPSILLRKSIQEEDDLYTYGLGALPDFYRWVKILLKHDVYIIEEELTCFRIRTNGGNTSGINPSNLIRNSFDLYKVLDLYKSINEKEFLKIFPEAKKYLVKKEIITEYALGQICLNMNNICRNTYRFYGLNLIYELLNNPNTRKKLKELYNYDHQPFVQATGTYDVFGMIQKGYFMDTSIFIGKDSVFNEDNKLTQKVSVLGSEGSFSTKFKLPKNVKKIRIDLDEDIYRSFSELKIMINGKKVKYEGNKTRIINNELVFLTVDPQIILESEENIKKVEINGQTKVIPMSEMENILTQKEENRIKRRLKRLLKR